MRPVLPFKSPINRSFTLRSKPGRKFSDIANEKDQVRNEILERKRKAEWKRRQGHPSFLDHLVINVKAGIGGDGCVAFHREKFKAFGPPSGGNGGRGGDVYILPTPRLTTLSSIPKRIRGEPGGNGRGTWQNGRNGAPLVIKVPLGTVVKELPRRGGAGRREGEDDEAEGDEGLSMAEKRERMREKRWIHYPRYEDDNIQREAFKDAEASLYRQERESRRARRARALNPLYLDLDKVEDVPVSPDGPLTCGGDTQHQQQPPLGHLIATGGMGGLGNPVFVSQTNRSPKFATRGYDGEHITLSLELKLLADVALVGMPNAGKSTLLRALTGGRARTEVAGYAFTTLNPVVGVIRVADDGTFEGALHGETIHEETWIEEQRGRGLMLPASHVHALPRNQTLQMDGPRSDRSGVGPDEVGRAYGTGHGFDLAEAFRFTVADNPGLISRASEDVGLGHSFLRAVERSLALVYVVDLSGPAPWDDLRTLRDELEAYKPGLSRKARVVVANKADLLRAEDVAEEEEARRKLGRLEEFVEREMGVVLVEGGGSDGGSRRLDVVPISAKFSLNLQKLVGFLRGYLEGSCGDKII